MKKLVIIDGKSVFYRGYYAMGALSTSDGIPTGGVYGFAVIAMEIVKNIRPEKVVVAWDKAGTSISKRKAIYADYKAGRKKPDEDFYVQIPLLQELVAALGWSFLEVDDYEADDIIGTLAKQASASDYETIIVSSDLDMLQIVDKNIKMYRLLKGFSKLEEIDVPALEKKYGISKDQFLDLKALKGDASDNIPGVPGIGEKGAVKLLNEYGSLKGIYEHIDEIKGSVHDRLVAGKNSAEMSYELGKIMFDAPVSLDKLPDLVVDGPKVVEALNKLEFRSLVRKFSDVLKVENEVEIKNNFEAPENLILEWDVKKKMHEDKVVAEKVLQDGDFWDLDQGKFLLNPLARVPNKEQGQVMLAFSETPEERQEKAEEYVRQVSEFEKLPKLYTILKDYDLPLIPVLYEMEKQGIKISREYFRELKAEYEQRVASIEQKIYDATEITPDGERRLHRIEFNINSPVQLSSVLFEKLMLPTKGIRKSQRGLSTGASELLKLYDLHPIVPLIIEYREASKLLNTYIIPLPDLADAEGRIHTTFTQNVTATGRLSSLNPNLQNIPVRTEEGRRIREGFVAEPGKKFIQADYSQFELRLAAVLSGDTALISDFDSGVDIHTKTASDVFGVPMDKVSKAQRRAAKTINFGVLYGMSAKSLAQQTEMPIYEAQKFIADYFEVRKPVRMYLDKVLAQARNEGYVETYYGRRRPTPDVKSPNFLVRQAAERAACNMPIQGTEADLMKRAMIKLNKILPDDVFLVLQIHDSLVVECPEEKVSEISEVLKREMEGIAPELKVRLEVEVKVGDNLGEV
ncbi:MAG: DNA polymerase [Candidatus Saccharibacteria bacterium]|nr:DNA polymerase [Candidatus Saccharibacteria bacterium]